MAPKRRLALAPGALRRLAAHDFPGNVRELRNVLERAALLADGDVVDAATIERSLAVAASFVRVGASASTTSKPVVPRSLHDAEREALRAAVAAHRGSREELARKLGASLRTLYRKLRELDPG